MTIDSKKLDTIFDTMSDGVLLIRKGGAIDYINPSARSILGTDENMSTITILLDFLLSYKINENFIDLIVNAVAEEGNLQQALVKYQNQSDTKGAKAQVKMLEVKASYSDHSDNEERSVLLLITDVTQREESYTNCRDSAIIVATLLGMLFLYAFLLTFMQMNGDNSGANTPIIFNSGRIETLVTWSCLLGGTIACFVTTKLTSLSLAKSGMRLSNLKDGIKLALRYIPFILIFAFVAKFILMQLFPSTWSADEPFFNWIRFTSGHITLGHILYPFSALMQEFLARVFVHENIERIFSIYGKNKAGIAAIILSSLFFACVHLHQGFYFMVGAFVLSVILGTFYHKTSNFWFVVLVHIIVGDLASSLF